MVKRYSLVLPVELFDEVQTVADRNHTTVLEVLRRFVKLGLLATRLAEQPDCTLIVREGEREREIVVLGDASLVISRTQNVSAGRSERGTGTKASELICPTCMEIHRRDTNRAVQCPYCGEIVGCFWHAGKAGKHIRACAAQKEG